MSKPEEQFIKLLEKVSKSYSAGQKEEYSETSCKEIDEASNNLYQFMNKISSSGVDIKTYFKFNQKQQAVLNSILFNLCRVHYPNYHLINLIVDIGADINYKENKRIEKRLDTNSIWLHRLPSDIEESKISKNDFFKCLIYATPLEAIFATLLYHEQQTMMYGSFQSTEVDIGMGARWMLPLFLLLKGADPNKVNLDYFAGYHLNIPLDSKGIKAQKPYDEKDFLENNLNEHVAKLFFILKDLKDNPTERANVLTDLKNALLRINVSLEERYTVASKQTKEDIKNTLLLLHRKKEYKSAKKPLISTLFETDENKKLFETKEDNKLITVFRKGNYQLIEKALQTVITQYEMRKDNDYKPISPN